MPWVTKKARAMLRPRPIQPAKRGQIRPLEKSMCLFTIPFPELASPYLGFRSLACSSWAWNEYQGNYNDDNGRRYQRDDYKDSCRNLFVDIRKGYIEICDRERSAIW